MFYFEIAEQYPNYKPNLTCSASTCGKSITNKQSLFECCGCKKCYHPHCKGVVGQHISRKAAEPFWFCSDLCQKSNAGQNSPNPEYNKNAEIIEKLQKHDGEFSEIKALMSEIKRSQEFISSEFDKLKVEYQKVVSDNTELLELLRKSNIVNKQQEEHIHRLEASIDDLHQNQIASNLIIAGLPNEDVPPMEVVVNLLNVMD